MTNLTCDVLIAGGGTGGCAAALAACRAGKRVIMTEPCDWIGGQLTSQAVPPDENRWIETHGGTRSYRAFRQGVRRYYQTTYPLTAAARHNPELNPGTGFVSRLCAEPKVAHAVLRRMLAPFESQGLLCILHHVEPIGADVDGDRVRAVTFRAMQPEVGLASGAEVTITAPYILDATELGDLLPLTGCEYVAGAESQAQTGEPHAASEPAPHNVQAFTWCFAMGHDPTPGADHTIACPPQYDHWRDYVPQMDPVWPDKLFTWIDYAPHNPEPRHHFLFRDEYDPDAGRTGISYFAYRQIIGPENWDADPAPHPVTIVNWAMNDYAAADLMSDDPAERRRAIQDSRRLSLSFLYWLQTESPNFTTGGQGYPGLYLRGDVVGTNDGLAQAPYIRESRRIRARFTVAEQHVSTVARTGFDYHWGDDLDPRLIGQRAAAFPDSIGIGHYRIDLHPSTGGDNSIDISALPFRIPLGALIPARLRNLLPACKNIGTTHITNGCYRLHPVEWNIGESAGALAAFCLDRGVEPAQVLDTPGLLTDYQATLQAQGVPLSWPTTGPA